MVRILLHREVYSLRMKVLSVAVVNTLPSLSKARLHAPWQCCLEPCQGHIAARAD